MALNKDFLLELLKISLRSSDVFELVKSKLDIKYLPDNSWKKIWQSAYDFYTVNEIPPTIGVISQNLNNEQEILAILSKVKSLQLPQKEAVLTQFSIFLKQAKFLSFHDKSAELYNAGKKDLAYKELQKFVQELEKNDVEIRTYKRIFSDFEKRNEKRLSKKEEYGVTTGIKVPFSIDELDFLTKGGMSEGDTALLLAQSGAGKTKFLRHVGVGAARKGFRVVHIQAEGTEDECIDGYDATWTGLLKDDLLVGKISPQAKLKIKKAVSVIEQQGGEIYIHAFEQFNSASMNDVRNINEDIERLYGPIDLIILDYLELFEPGDGKRYTPEQERARREAVGNKFKNICVEFKSRGISATQASTVDPKLLNNPDYVMTRYNVSEFKGVVRPFSFFITYNQTADELEEEIARLHCDKLRNYKSGQTIKIYQNYNRDRFYDGKRTREFFFKQKVNETED